MAIVPAHQSFTFYDAKQQQARLSLYLGNDTTNPATGVTDGNQINLDLAALSNSSHNATGFLRGSGLSEVPPFPVTPGTAAVYQDVADKAVFVFQDFSGQLHRYQVPCPLAAIFLADAETIDFTVTAVKQFCADMTAASFGGTAPITVNAVRSRNNVAMSAAVGGYRRRGKTPRKFNIYTRNPALSGQGE